MANKRVRIYHGDELRLDSLIPEEHFGRGFVVTNRLMGYPPFTVGDKIVVGEVEIGEILAVVQAPMDDRWEVFYRVIVETVEAVPAEAVPPAGVEAVPAQRRRVRKRKVTASPAGPVLAEAAPAGQADADARLALAMLASMEGADGEGVPGAGGYEDEG
jgi:hypothetical protein